MKKTIIGYLPTAIVFGGPPSAFLFITLLGVLNGKDDIIKIAAFLSGFSLIFTFPIGGILNLAFLAYAFFTDRLENVLRDSSTSEGIVSKGGVVTAIITLVIQLGIILCLSVIGMPNCVI
jgi:hypothetical protein